MYDLTRKKKGTIDMNAKSGLKTAVGSVHKFYNFFRRDLKLANFWDDALNSSLQAWQILAQDIVNRKYENSSTNIAQQHFGLDFTA